MVNLFNYLRRVFTTALIAPIILISIYTGFLFFLRGAIPSSAEIISHFAALYERFGYEIIFLGALLESLIVINFFVPGALTVALGAIFARSGQLDLAIAVLVASSAAMIGFIIDFILGYFGFGEIIKKLGYSSALQKVKRQIEKSGIKSFSLGFIHPNIGSLVSLAAGTLKIRFSTFVVLGFLSTIAWVSFWGLLIFSFGDIFLLILTRYVYVVVLLVLSVWILTIIYGRSKYIE